jgi:hypothetical protein
MSYWRCIGGFHRENYLKSYWFLGAEYLVFSKIVF